MKRSFEDKILSVDQFTDHDNNSSSLDFSSSSDDNLEHISLKTCFKPQEETKVMDATNTNSSFANRLSSQPLVIDILTNHYRPKVKPQLGRFDNLPIDFKEATDEERQCLTDLQAAERCLMIKCKHCDKYIAISTTTVYNKRCRKHKDDPCRTFYTQCKYCARIVARRSKTKRRANPNSNENIVRRKYNVTKRLKTANDSEWRNRNRIQSQQNYFNTRQLEQPLYAEFYKLHNLEYGQCSGCKRINPLLIDLDHDKELMGQHQQKLTQVSSIHNLKAKIKEMEKTRPLCVRCHSIKTHKDRNLIAQLGNGKISPPRRKAYQIIHEAKSSGCVCCGLANPTPTLGIGYWFFELDHVDNASKTDWFKTKRGFNFNYNKYKKNELEMLIQEIQQCHTLCRECHRLKTYLEHPLLHTLSRHNWLRKDRPDFIIWYNEVYKNNPRMLSNADSIRSKTDEFVPIITDLPYRPVKQKDNKDDD